MNNNEEEAWASIHEYDYLQAKQAEKANKKAQKEYFKTEKQYVYNEITYWETKDGKKINIDEMTIEHLRRTLKLIVNRKLLKDK